MLLDECYLFFEEYLQEKKSLLSIYQISEYQFSRVLIGSRNSEYPWLFTLLRSEPRWQSFEESLRGDKLVNILSEELKK